MALATYLIVLGLHLEVMNLSSWSDCLPPHAKQDVLVLAASWE